MIFEGLHVLELASVLAGPGAGQFFSEMGATVIKVENLATGGDVTRTWKVSGEKEGDLSAYFCSVNWGKKSLAVDLTKEDGKKIVRTLSDRADIVIASFKAGDAEKLGVDYDSLRKLNPSLIYGQITGYGSQDSRVGYDAVIQAEAGFMDINGEKGGPPVKMPVALVDVLAGHQLKEALLMALLKKERSGSGSFVEVSLIQTAMASLVNQASNWLIAGVLPHRQGSAHPNIAPYGEVFVTADEKLILFAVGNDRQFASLCSVLGLQSLAGDVRFTTNSSRVVNRLALNIHLADKVGLWMSRDLVHALNTLKVPAGVVANIKEALESSEAKELLIDSNGLSGVRSYVGSGEKYELARPPHFGEHTDEVLRSLGYAVEDITAMKLARIIG